MAVPTKRFKTALTKHSVLNNQAKPFADITNVQEDPITQGNDNMAFSNIGIHSRVLASKPVTVHNDDESCTFFNVKPERMDAKPVCESLVSGMESVKKANDIQEVAPFRNGVVDIDRGEHNQHGHLNEVQYAQNIFENFLKVEKNCMTDVDFLDFQKDISPRMRAILIDWLVDVHLRFSLRSNTLFLTVNIIDRYLARRIVSRQELQLVGLTAMVIAAKYEEIYAPQFQDFVHISDNTYSADDILRTEASILEVLSFDVTLPYSLTFLRRLMRVCEVVLGKVDYEHVSLSRYLLELSLVSIDMLNYRPSLLAAAACKFSASLTSGTLAWDSTMKFYSGGLCEEDLTDCEKDFAALLKRETDPQSKHKLTAIRRKFSSRTYCRIAELAEGLQLGTTKT